MHHHTIIPYVSLCSGYEGIGLGLHRCIPNLRAVAYCEREAFAVANLVAKMENGFLDSAPVFTDVATFPWAELTEVMAGGVLSFGWPCQPVSTAGKRKATEDERWLFDIIADGIAIMRPGILFAENVEGLLSAKMPDGSSVFGHCIQRLESLHYRVAAGIFSASEVGAPHQRKRIFILAHNQRQRVQELNRRLADGMQQHTAGDHGSHAWPSRPGEQQYGWEPPRVVADSHRVDRSAQAEGRQHDRQAGSTGEEMGNTGCERQEERQVEAGGSEQSDQDLADSSIGGSDGRSDGSSGRIWQPGEVSVDAAGCGGQGNGMRQTQPAVGLHVDECSSVLGQALTLNPHGGNVFWNETIFKKTRAREVLFEVWHQAGTEGFQWETGRLQRFLEEKVLQSGVQLDGFTQRICFFVWCLQTGYQTQGWGLHGMQVYESSRNTSQGQEPMEQLKRELAYAMCQLSYEIALERGQDSVETTGIMQGVRESSERSWALSEALPEMEEVWRSTLDQTVWENGCFIEAASKGNRTDELRLLGNGVVPATAELAYRTLMRELLQIPS